MAQAEFFTLKELEKIAPKRKGIGAFLPFSLTSAFLGLCGCVASGRSYLRVVVLLTVGCAGALVVSAWMGRHVSSMCPGLDALLRVQFFSL